MDNQRIQRYPDPDRTAAANTAYHINRIDLVSGHHIHALACAGTAIILIYLTLDEGLCIGLMDFHASRYRYPDRTANPASDNRRDRIFGCIGHDSSIIACIGNGIFIDKGLRIIFRKSDTKGCADTGRAACPDTACNLNMLGFCPGQNQQIIPGIHLAINIGFGGIYRNPDCGRPGYPGC